VANGGRTDVSCWGGILTRAALTRGIAGVMIDGACRDIGEAEELGFPVFGRAVVPVSARGRIAQLAAGEPVVFAGVQVTQGDYVVADRSGVVFVPAGRAAEVLAFAERIVAREEQMAAAVLAGEPVTTVMHDAEFPVPLPRSGVAAARSRVVLSRHRHPDGGMPHFIAGGKRA
jgi:regulator of RNase E activity RraA